MLRGRREGDGHLARPRAGVLAPPDRRVARRRNVVHDRAGGTSSTTTTASSNRSGRVVPPRRRGRRLVRSRAPGRPRERDAAPIMCFRPSPRRRDRWLVPQPGAVARARGGFGGAGGGLAAGTARPRSRAAFDHARGGDGDVDDLFRPVPARAARGGAFPSLRMLGGTPDDDARSRSFVVPEPAHSASSSSSWMHEMWDETKHLTHEVEKFALKRVGTSGKRDAETARGAGGRDAAASARGVAFRGH